MTNFPVSKKNELNITVKQWRMLLENSTVFNDMAIQVVKSIYSFEDHCCRLDELSNTANLELEDILLTIDNTESNIRNYLNNEYDNSHDDEKFYYMFVLNNKYYEIRKNLITAIENSFDDLKVEYKHNINTPQKIDESTHDVIIDDVKEILENYPLAKQERLKDNPFANSMRNRITNNFKAFLKNILPNVDLDLKMHVGQGSWSNNPWIGILDTKYIEGNPNYNGNLHLSVIFNFDNENPEIRLEINQGLDNFKISKDNLPLMWETISKYLNYIPEGFNVYPETLYDYTFIYNTYEINNLNKIEADLRLLYLLYEKLLPIYTNVVDDLMENKTQIINDFKSIMKNYPQAKLQPVKDNQLAKKMREDYKNDLEDIVNSIVDDSENFNVKISYGQGTWVNIPWAGIRNDKVAKTFNDGLYIMYRFNYDKNNINLSINQGLSKYNNHEKREYLLDRTKNLRNLVKTPATFTKENNMNDDSTQTAIIHKSYDIDNLDPEIIVNDLEILIEIYESLFDDYNEIAHNDTANKKLLNINMKNRRVWKIASGDSKIASKEWTNFKNGNYVGIGFNNSFDCDDFSVFKNMEELEDKFIGDNKNSHDVYQVWNFVNKIKIGDIVIINKGLSEVYGIGIVESDYIAPAESKIDNSPLNHIRKVKWICTEPFKVIERLFSRQTIYEIKENRYFKIIHHYYNQFPKLRDKLFSLYMDEFSEFLDNNDGKKHMKRYESESNDFKKNFLKIRRNIDRGIDQTDEILSNLISPKATMFTFIHDNKKFFKAKYGYNNKQLTAFADLIYETLNSFYQSDKDLNTILSEFINNPYSKGIKIATLSPSLYYLNNDYYVINTKTSKTINDLNILDKGYVQLSCELEDYDDSNNKYHKFLADISATIPEFSSFEYFDAFCNWYINEYGRISLCCYEKKDENIIDEPEEVDVPELNLNPNEFKSELKLDKNNVYDSLSMLNSGKHIILEGVPGTGKTVLANEICEFAKECGFIDGFITTTATSSWTTFDLIGGLLPDDNGGLKFEEGLFLKSIRNNEFLIIDELNRADIDKAFGQLFTVLSGASVELNYKINNKNIQIKATDENRSYYDEDLVTYFVGKNFRIIATMNSYDKNSLYDLSYAFMRRFGFVEIDIPDKEIFDELIEEFFIDTPKYIPQLKQLYYLNEYRKLGMSIFKDISVYVKEITQYTTDDIIEKAIISFIIPQYEGLSPSRLEKIENYLTDTMQLRKDLIEPKIRDLKGLLL